MRRNLIWWFKEFDNSLILKHFNKLDVVQCFQLSLLFFAGIIFISIAEWFCRVKIYHRYGQNHQQTLERLSGIERRLNTGGNTLDYANDEPPPYNTNTAFVAHELPSVNTYARASRATTVTDVPVVAPDIGSEEVPSYSITVSDDVLPTYNEATSSDFGVAKK